MKRPGKDGDWADLMVALALLLVPILLVVWLAVGLAIWVAGGAKP
jgi:ABC-type proline/glycine betaine transport system permease subunit